MSYFSSTMWSPETRQQPAFKELIYELRTPSYSQPEAVLE